MTMPNASQTGMGWKPVRVQAVDGSKAIVVDAMGTTLNVRADYRTGAGPKPRVGEEWIIDRSLGFWTFQMLVRAKPVEITGSNGGIPAVQNLLTALADAGLIVDNTTDDPLHAPIGHTH